MTRSKKSLTYKKAGVSIKAGNRLVQSIIPLIKKTTRPEVISSLGGFASLFNLDLKRFPAPVLVATTDGVGTKLKLAFELNDYHSVGVDLVAMCVNDLICCGAEPLFFLDYFATGFLNQEAATTVISSVCDALVEINCALVGGETAEMPGLYKKGEFDLAGFAVGVVGKGDIIDGREIAVGDSIIGLQSSGPHSNGFSLIRKILKDKKINPKRDRLGLDKPIGAVLMRPTQIYVKPVLSLLQKIHIKGIAHITGGSFIDKISRIIPQGLKARIEKKRVSTPPIFRVIQEAGSVTEGEMWRVFNMGVGMVLVVKEEDESPILSELSRMKVPAGLIGKIVKRENGGRGVEIV